MTTKARLESRRDPVNETSRREAAERVAPLTGVIRHLILKATTRAGSGHPTSSLSAADLMAGLLFGGSFHYDVSNPLHPNNDRLIFSKGHASPLFYALWTVAGQLSEDEMMSYRRFGSVLEGHPTPAMNHVEAATGSLGQGLSIGVGMAMNARHLDKLPYRTYVLLGDGELAEGAQWEAMELAAHYGLDNLTGVLDVNRLGQCGETLYGHDLSAYQARVSAFGWHTILIDGHSLPEIIGAFDEAREERDRPTMIIARTIKGKGAPELEDQTGWHGKTLDEDQLKRAIEALGEVDPSLRGRIPPPGNVKPERPVPGEVEPMRYDSTDSVATRAAYGNALKRICTAFPQIVGLDGEVSNSTKAETLARAAPRRFFEMYIAEQNMVGAAVGLSRRAKIPFVSTFAAFLTRAFDQIRMARYSNANIKFVGSHAGVSIGEDGPSQMGLEDIAMFRTVLDSVVLHPADAISTERLVEEAARHVGMVYLRTMRQKTPLIYPMDEEFPIGGSKTLRSGPDDMVTVVAAGATVHEALEAADALKEENVPIRVIDAYSIKPVDRATLRLAAEETGRVVTVEDHYAEGGLGEAVMSALADSGTPVHQLAVRQMPRSGTPEELRDMADICAEAIVAQIKEIVAGDTK